MEMAISFLASLAFLFKEKEIDAKVIFAGRTFYPKDSIQPLLIFLAEWNASSAEKGKLELPLSRDAVTLLLRSRKIPPRLENMPGAKALFLEDWQHLLVEKGILQI